MAGCEKLEGQQKLKWLLCGIALFYFVNWTVKYGLFRYLESGGVLWLALKDSTQRSFPLILLVFEPWKRHTLFEKHKQPIKYSLLIVVVAGLAIFNSQINNYWNHIAIIEWAVLSFTLLWLYDYKIQNLFFASYLAVLSVSMGSLFYELPLLPHMTGYQIIGLRFPCIIGTPFISLPLLIHGLSTVKFQTNKPIVLTLTFFLIYSLVWSLTSNPFQTVPYELMRLPMMTVLLSIPLSLKGQKHNG